MSFTLEEDALRRTAETHRGEADAILLLHEVFLLQIGFAIENIVVGAFGFVVVMRDDKVIACRHRRSLLGELISVPLVVAVEESNNLLFRRAQANVTRFRSTEIDLIIEDSDARVRTVLAHKGQRIIGGLVVHQVKVPIAVGLIDDRLNRTQYRFTRVIHRHHNTDGANMICHLYTRSVRNQKIAPGVGASEIIENESGNGSPTGEARLHLIEQAIHEVSAIVTVGQEELACKAQAG